MHPKAHPPLRIVLRPSRIGAATTLVLHGLALVAALGAPDPVVAGGLLVLVLSSGWSSVRAWLGRGRPDRARAVERDGAGRWSIETCAGERLEVSLAGPPTVGQPIVVLSFQGDGRRWDVALLPDSADRDALRRLRATLRAAG